MMIIAGDIGGTNSRLGIFSPEKGPGNPLKENTYPTANFHSAIELIGTFMEQAPYPVDRICLGVAGPITEGKVIMTNLPWTIREREMTAALKVKSVRFINDMLALASALPILKPSDLLTLQEGVPETNGPIALVAAGTGLGEAFLVWDGVGYRAFPSEGGHADFAPQSDLEMELMKNLQKKFCHVGYDRVCTGPGIAGIYQFLREGGYVEEPEWLASRMKLAQDIAPVIAEVVLNRENHSGLCEKTLEMFISVLGAEASNMALTILATGGMYLGGGIAPKLIPLLSRGGFIESFCRKGRMSNLAARIPIHVIMEPKAGLYGAAACCLTDLA
ncbi:MAG: glucokinase [Syntrophales bacterium]|jgi:glucokinase